MALFKCKMCGGTIEISDESVVTCDYCGTRQTLPKLNDERHANLHDRANYFRRSNEFDKAMGIYEQILTEDNTDAEAYWSLVLCRYGIEYVEDPSTRKRVPTVNRAQLTSIFDDVNYKSALEHADMYQRILYEAEAKAINEIQKGILAISQKEEPFDVFICYKETDNNGRRTLDSVLANELYHQLIQEGFKVFFSRITLEDKLGVAYEPYIFAALNSAKVMVVLGTKKEYFNAVWVKNEWSRYLAMIKTGAKKILIPAYRDMDPYDLPDEFSHLQAQDMSKLGFMQDLIRGIKKITQKEELTPTVVRETVITAANTNIAPLLKRAFLFLEDKDWKSADEYCERVLDNDPECAQAYLGKLMAELQVCKQDDLKVCAKPFDNRKNYQKAIRFADDQLREFLVGCIIHINERNEIARLDGIYVRAKALMDLAKEEAAFKEAGHLFETIGHYKDAGARAQECYEHAEIVRLDLIYNAAKKLMAGNQIANYKEAIQKFEKIKYYKDSEALIQECRERAETARKDAIYNAAKKLMNSNQIANYQAAITEFEKIKHYKDAAALITECHEKAEAARKDKIYNAAKKLMTGSQPANYLEAIKRFEEIPGWKDTDECVEICHSRIIELETKKERSREKAEACARKTKKIFRLLALLLCIALIIPPALKSCGNMNKEPDMSGWNPSAAISVNNQHVAVVNKDGTVCVSGDEGYSQADVSDWTDIVSVSAASDYIVGLKRDGTVVAAGNVFLRIGNVSLWKNIVSINAKNNALVGLKANGKVAGTGQEYYSSQMRYWNNIVAISSGGFHTVGLYETGRVAADGSNEYGQCDVSGWTDIVAVEAGWTHTVGLKSDGTVVAVGDNRNGQCNVSDWKDIIAIGAGDGKTVGLKADGTVVCAGSDATHFNLSGLTDIVAIDVDWNEIIALRSDGTAMLYSYGAVSYIEGIKTSLDAVENPSNQIDYSDRITPSTISIGWDHIAGLKTDGTVVADGSNEYGQCNVADWADITSVSVGTWHTVGLKADGTVVAVGRNNVSQCDVTGWTDIAAIDAGEEHTVGLKANGRVVATGRNYSGQCNVFGWKDIVAISAGEYHTVGLKADGTVVASGDNQYDQCNVFEWMDIISIYAGSNHTVGLKADGTVVAVGYNEQGQCDVTEWTDIVAIAAGQTQTVGLKADGTLVVAGRYGNGWHTYGWTDLVAIDMGGGRFIALRSNGTTLASAHDGWISVDLPYWENIQLPNGESLDSSDSESTVEPVGNEKTFWASTSGPITVHSVKMQPLNNGYVRFAIEVTAKEGYHVSFFNPPNGDVIAYLDYSGTTGERQTLIFTVPQEHLKSVSSITVKFMPVPYLEEEVATLNFKGPF